MKSGEFILMGDNFFLARYKKTSGRGGKLPYYVRKRAQAYDLACASANFAKLKPRLYTLESVTSETFHD